VAHDEENKLKPGSVTLNSPYLFTINKDGTVVIGDAVKEDVKVD